MYKQAIVQFPANRRALTEISGAFRNWRVSTGPFASVGILAFAALCSLALAQGIQSAAHASETNGYKATYIVDLDGFMLGVSERTVEAGDNFIVTSTHVLEPQGLAELLGETRYTDVSRMDLSDNRIRTMSSRRDAKSSSDSYSAQFDWDGRIIRFSSGNEISMPQQNVYDFESWFMLLMLYPDELQVGNVLSILERENRLRSYEVVKNDTDSIDFKGQMIDTLRIRLRDIQDSDRGFTAWIVPQYYNLVLELVKQKGSTELRFTMESFGQIAAGAN